MHSKLIILIIFILVLTGCQTNQEQENSINTEPIILEKEEFVSDWEKVDAEISEEVLTYFYSATKEKQLNELIPEKIIGIQETGGKAYKILCSSNTGKKVVTIFIDNEKEVSVTNIENYD